MLILKWKKYIPIILLCINAHVLVLGQNSDSLLKLVEKTTNSKELIELYNKLGNSLRYAYPDSALIFYQKGYTLAISENDNLSKAEAIGAIGTVWAIKNNYDTASYYLNLSIDLYKKSNYNLGVAKGYNSLGLLELKHENSDLAKTILNEALKFGESLNDSNLLAKTYNNLGLLFKQNNDFDSALFYYQHSLKIKELLNDEDGIGSTTNNIGLIYEKTKNYELALVYLNQSLEIRKKLTNKYAEALVLNNIGLVYESMGNINKALEHYLLSLAVMQELNKKSNIAILHNNIGSVYTQLKNYKKGFEHLQKGLALNQELGNVRSEIYSRLALAQFYEKLRIYQNAIPQCKKALVLSKKINNLSLDAEIYQALYGTYEKADLLDSALLYYKKYVHINDSISKITSQRNIEKLEIEYQTLKKDQENEALVQLNHLNQEKIKRQLIIAIVLFSLLSILGVFAIMVIRSSKKLKQTFKLVLTQRNNIQKQSIELKKAYKKLQEFSDFKEEVTSMIVHDLKNPLNVILNASEINNSRENKLLVHQSGKQMMNLIMNILDVYKHEETTLKLEQNRIWINSVLHNVRSDLDFLIDEKSIDYQTITENDFLLDIDKSVIIRVLVNLLSNGIKFSANGGKIILKTIKLDTNKVRIEVVDTGNGIADQNTEIIFSKFQQIERKNIGYSGSTGIGLAFCKMAIEAHDGKIGVDSELGKGSTFWFELNYIKSKIEKMSGENFEQSSFVLSKENQLAIYPYALQLNGKNIFEVTEIRKILNHIDRTNQEIECHCKMLEESVSSCNQDAFDKHIKLIIEQ